MRRPIAMAGPLLILLVVACGDPSDAGQHHSRGVELSDEGRWEEAIEEYGRVWGGKTPSVSARHSLG